MQHRIKTIASWTILSVLFMQFIPLDRVNHPSPPSAEIRNEVKTILKKNCFDCHSNETRWPRIAYIAPMSWFIAHEVTSGRQSLNFSRWPLCSDSATSVDLSSIHRLLLAGTINSHSRILLNNAPALTGQEEKILLDWSEPGRK